MASDSSSTTWSASSFLHPSSEERAEFEVMREIQIQHLRGQDKGSVDGKGKSKDTDKGKGKDIEGKGKGTSEAGRPRG